MNKRAPARSGSALAGAAEQREAGVGEDGFEGAAGVVLVRDQDLSGAGGEQGVLVVEQVEQDLPLIGLGAGQREADGQPVQGGDQVQAQSQKKRE